MRWHSLFPVLFVLASGVALHAAPTPSPSPSAAASPAAGKPDRKADDAGKEAKDSGQFDIPVPMNMPVHGIKVPHRDEKGRLVMVLEADIANKLDDQRIEMTNMKVDAFDEDGKKIHIELPSSIFNLDTRVLMGSTHALIRREDFEITGDSLEFNTKTRYGKVRGNVKMIILTADNPQ